MRASEVAVDIVVNNHNYGPYLAEAIESARRQTHQRTRVIVVDDGSTDESREVLAGQSAGVTVILKENGGQASALNAGFEESSGDIVIFLDADDVLRPEVAAGAAERFAGDVGLSKVQFRMEVIDAEGRPTGEVKPPDHLPMPSGDLRSAELAYPYDLVWMATSGNAFSREALRRIMPIPEGDYPATGADWYLVHLSTLLGMVASEEQIGAAYRVHGANSYELDAGLIDLPHLRQAIEVADATSRELLALARELDLSPPQRILSVADLANRMTSLKLEPGRHPIAGDRPLTLLRDAIEACRRRDKVSPTMKLLFLTWFATMAIAPRALARRLAALFMFPSRRRGLNRFLGRQQGTDGKAQRVA